MTVTQYEQKTLQSRTIGAEQSHNFFIARVSTGPIAVQFVYVASWRHSLDAYQKKKRPHLLEIKAAHYEPYLPQPRAAVVIITAAKEEVRRSCVKSF